MSNVTKKEIHTEIVWTKKFKYIKYAEMTERTLNKLALFGCWVDILDLLSPNLCIDFNTHTNSCWLFYLLFIICRALTHWACLSICLSHSVRCSHLCTYVYTTKKVTRHANINKQMKTFETHGIEMQLISNWFANRKPYKTKRRRWKKNEWIQN